MRYTLPNTHTLGEIIEFAQTRGFSREDAWDQLISLCVKRQSGDYTARIRAIMKEMENESD